MAGSRKLGRTSDHRKAMLRGMVTLLLEKGKIVTTVARAKEVRSAAEKMITLGKAGTLHTKRQVYSIIKIGPRRGDAAEMAVIELV